MLGSSPPPLDSWKDVLPPNGYSFSSYFLEDVPLSQYEGLHQDTEEEEEGLVHGGEVDPGVEGDEEDQLHQEGGVDEDVGQTQTQSDQDTAGWTFLCGVDDSWNYRYVVTIWPISD